MKKNKIISLFVFFAIVLILNINTVLASFADFTDEQADKQAQEQIKEQEKEHNITEVKSSDNYLLNLQVEGYKLTPEFDKQTLEYTIKEEIKDNEMNIKATQSNEKATINGDGNVKIEDGKKDYRIDVTAENGSVRTYIIKLNATTDNKKTNNDAEINSINKDVIEIESVNENTEQGIKEKESSNIKIYIVIGVIIFLVIVLFIVILKGRKKGKH